MTKTAKQVLTEARDMALIPGVLSSGTLVGPRPDGGLCYCSLGLIALAEGYQVHNDDGHDPRFIGINGNYAELDSSKAVNALANAIVSDGYWGEQALSQLAPTNIVYRFNDRYSRASNTLVVDMFNKAIELADAQ